MTGEPVQIIAQVQKGPSIKYVTLDGGGGPRRCDSFWQRGGGPRACDITLFKFFSYIWNMKVMFSFLLQRVYSGRRGNGQKPAEQNPKDKNPVNYYQSINQSVFIIITFCTFNALT